MSVYISGLKIPQDGRVTLQIDSNGGVYVVNKFSITSEKYEKSMTATEIQPHGDLVDLSDTVHPNDSMRYMTIDEQLRRTCEGWSADRKQYVVIEAEEET